MASKKTVTLDNLAPLGAERLATILVELADGDAEIKRRLRLELAAEEGGDSIAAEIGKRLTALRSARSFVDWQKQRDFVRDLDLQRAMIVDRVATTRADLALDLMWRFLDLAEPVINRVDDSNGSVGDVFRLACEDLGTIAVRAKPHAAALADRVFAALLNNDYGVYDGLVPTVLPALGDAGVEQLQGRLRQALAKESTAHGSDGRAEVVRRALLDIADGQGDVDGYIALVTAADRSKPHVAAEIGRRLLAVGRAAEALASLDRAKPQQRAVRVNDEDVLFPAGHGAHSAWEGAYIDALDATGQLQEAQRLRWAAFEERLSLTYLRTYLKRLPDFEDVEAEDRAMQHALRFANFSSALNFFCEWPDQACAAQLVMARASEIDGNLYFLLDPVARLIEGKHPMAATLLRRAMIEHTLNRAKSTRYKHAARHLLECASLAPRIADIGNMETHDSFVSRLRVKHGRKAGFWGQLNQSMEAGQR